MTRFARMRAVLALAGMIVLTHGAQAQTSPKPVTVRGGITLAAPRVVAPAARHGRGLALPDAATIQAKRRAITEVMTQLQRADAAARASLSKSAASALPELQIRSRVASPTAPAFDWTALIPNWQVKDQGTCGSCFTFAAAAAFEASWYIRNGTRISVSEQCLFDRTNSHVTCESGGWSAEVLTEIMLQGVPNQADYPYTGAKQAARTGVAKPYHALAWGFVGAGVGATTEEIKAALVMHGPLTYSVFADEPASGLQQLQSAELGNSNHEVLIVGWDDRRFSWRVRNSWGADWGEGHDGYAWVHYLDNDQLCGPVLWVDATCDRYALPPIPLPAPCPELAAQASGLEAMRSRLATAGAVTAEAQNALGAVIYDLRELANPSTRGHALAHVVDDGSAAGQRISALLPVAARPPGNDALLKAARDAMAANQRTLELAGACAAAYGFGTPPVSRDLELLGFHVRLDSGASAEAAGGVTLTGTVSVWPVAKPSVKLTFRDATFTVHGTPALYNAYDGSGELTVSEGGASCEFGRASLRCTAPGQASGSAKLTRYNHTFDLGYAISGQTFRGTAIWNGGDAGWFTVGGADGAEYHVVEPRVEFAAENARLTTSLCCRKLELRTKQRNPAAGNAPWASLELNPPCAVVGNGAWLDMMGRTFQTLGDPNAVRRNECMSFCPNVPNPPPGSRPGLPGPVRDAYDAAMRVFEEGRRKHDDCVNLCTSAAPSPPPLPVLPSSISIQVEVVVK